MKPIPVIILNWNGFDDTVECVDSVLNQSFSDFVIYLTDNGSDNNEFEKLHAKYSDNPKVILLKNEINLGFTLAHNQLFEILKSSGAEHVALINNDAVADLYWLENAIKTAITEKADMVACKMVNYYDRSLIDSNGLFLLSSGEILPIDNGKKSKSVSDIKKPIAVSGGACLYRLQMLNEIGSFDPYFSTGYEDAELGLRAFIVGKKIIANSNSIVYHKVSQSVSKIIDQKRIQKIQEDINYTYYKLMPDGVIIFNVLFNIPRIVFILIIHLITFRFKFIVCFVKATKRTFLTDWNQIRNERIKFLKLRKRSTFEILRAQRFWLFFDLKRFYTYIITGQKNQFEKY
jgi:GT2 family glycosyltransferase